MGQPGHEDECGCGDWVGDRPSSIGHQLVEILVISPPDRGRSGLEALYVGGDKQSVPILDLAKSQALLNRVGAATPAFPAPPWPLGQRHCEPDPNAVPPGRARLGEKIGPASRDTRAIGAM